MSIARTYFKSSEKKPEIITWPEIWKAAQWRREGASLKAKSELITKSSCRKKQKKKKKILILASKFILNSSGRHHLSITALFPVKLDLILKLSLTQCPSQAQDNWAKLGHKNEPV